MYFDDKYLKNLSEFTIDECLHFLKNEIDKKDLRIKELEEQVEHLKEELNIAYNQPIQTQPNVSKNTNSINIINSNDNSGLQTQRKVDKAVCYLQEKEQKKKNKNCLQVISMN